MQPRLISCITALLNGPTDERTETELCDALCDTIIDTDDDFDQADIDLIMATARYTDPTESFHAAHIRDALRDNGHEV